MLALAVILTFVEGVKKEQKQKELEAIGGTVEFELGDPEKPFFPGSSTTLVVSLPADKASTDLSF